LRRTGAIVLSSSRGNEVSFETEEAQNGLFTEEILRALTSNVADGNHDGLLDDKELRTYVARAVARQSGDQQHPVVDTDNMDQRIELPIVPQASAILSRRDPAVGRAGTRGLDLSGNVASASPSGAGFDPCALEAQPPHGCGCTVPGQSAGGHPGLWGLGLLTLARLRRRARAPV